jgi:hypothetical protein
MEKLKISAKSPISGLKRVISHLFEVKLDELDLSPYHSDLPEALKEMYAIDTLSAQHDCAFETTRFFANQDRLVPYHELALDTALFTFVRENQSNWLCKSSLGSRQVYFQDRVMPENSGYLLSNLERFLTTFALQEIGFNLPLHIGINCEKVSDILPTFQSVTPIWVDEKYLNALHYEYYLIDEDCLLMQAGMHVLATKNEEKMEYYKRILDYYTF